MAEKISLKMVFSYPTEEIAKKVLRSVKPDNEGYIESRVEDSGIISKAESHNILGLRATVDDLLACLTTSEQVILKENSDK